MDAQSVKNTDTAEEKGYDAGKKVAGIKRHLIVDTQGFLQGLSVTPANTTDREGAIQALERAREALSQCTCLLVDGGYTGSRFQDRVKALIPATVRVVKRTELHTFVVMPQRWVVERTFAWFEKSRRLWKNCERKLNTSLQFLVLSHLALLLKRL